MKFLGRKSVRTCLSMLLIVTCLLASFSFYIDSKAQDQVVERFYVLDEEGNTELVEIARGDLSFEEQSTGIQLFSRLRSSVDTRTNVIGVVRFKSTVNELNQLEPVYYKEIDTNRDGYFSCKMAGDAAYLGTESDGSVICKLSGAVMRVPSQYVKEIVSYQNCGEKEISYYYIADNGYLIHNYTYYDGASLASRGLRVGYNPGCLNVGVKYYSYDGHYFYTDFAQMISDYQNGTYSNAVNASTPYYNYYQYLSMHTKSSITPEQYNAHVAAEINEEKTKSVMLTTGNNFAAAQNTYTINALLMFGVAINESAWGTSNYAITRNNLFGLNAVDSNPDDAKLFSSVAQCINEFAYNWMHKGYLKGSDSRYRGPHLGDKHSGINVKYASDPYWGEKAAARGYYLDTNKVDYGRYTIGIASSGKISCYKEPDAKTVIYTTDASNGSYIYDFPVIIQDVVAGTDGGFFYKIVSDMSLKPDRSARDVNAYYDTNRDYVYVRATDIQVVFKGSGDINIPDIEIQGKTHAEVLATLNVSNSNNQLTGFSVGSDVATAIAKVRALDSNIQVVVKKADGTQITSGIVATGMQMTITTNGSTVNYTIVIRGDISGDGRLSAIDYVMVRNYLDGARALSGAYLKSADTNSDGKASALDYVILRNHLDNKSTIVQ